MSDIPPSEKCNNSWTVGNTTLIFLGEVFMDVWRLIKKYGTIQMINVATGFFWKLYLGARESASKLYIFLLLKTWYVCNFRFVWPYYFKFEQYQVMGQNFEKKVFLIFLTPQGAPRGGLSENFQHDWFLYQNSFQTILSNFWKKSWKKIFFKIFGVPRTPLKVNFSKKFLRGGM